MFKDQMKIKKMNILIFPNYYTPHIGGVENYTQELCRHLSEKGFHLTIFTPHIPCDSPEKEIQPNNLRIIRFPAFEIVPNYPLPKFWKLKFWKLFLGLFKENFNIVISQTRFFFTSLIALIYAKIKKIRLIHIEHGSDFVLVSNKLTNICAKTYDLTLGKLILKSADVNIAISKAAKKFIKTLSNQESIVIYRGLELREIDRIEPDAEIKEKYKDKTIIAFTGRLSKWKGVENTALAIQELPQGIKEKVIFIIAGDGEDFNKLKKMENESIQMLGRVKREKVYSILKAADIYIHSAHPGGGLSTSLLEAMYCKCAIIASPNEGADEVIENNVNGLKIPESSKDLIKKAIIKLVNNPNLISSYSEKSKITVLENFTWEKSIGKFLDLLNESNNL